MGTASPTTSPTHPATTFYDQKSYGNNISQAKTKHSTATTFYNQTFYGDNISQTKHSTATTFYDRTPWLTTPTQSITHNTPTPQILRGIRDVINLSVFAGPDSPLPFGHFEAPLNGGGAAAAHRPHEGWLFGMIKRGAFSGRRRTVMLPDIPLPLIKKIKVAAAGRGGRENCRREEGQALFFF